MDSVVVVGASLAGFRAVESLREQGFGGRVVLIGDEPHRPYNRPPLSKELLAGKFGAERCLLKVAGGELDVDWKLGAAAERLDVAAREVVLATGERVRYDGLVIASGARARAWPSGPLPRRGVHLLRTLDDALALKRDLATAARVVVVGGGFIGSEVAATCRGLGLEAAMVDPLELPLERAVGRVVAEACVELHRRHGVELRLGVGVAAFEGEERLAAVLLADGTRLPADVAVLGLGAEPNVEWLAGAGLRLEPGVVCGPGGRVPDLAGVVAAGDVAMWPSPLGDPAVVRIEHWGNAATQGAVAARTLLGAEPPDPAGLLNAGAFWSDQHGVRMKSIGVTHGADRFDVVDGRPEDLRFVGLYHRGDRVVGALGFGDARGLLAQRARVLGAPVAT